MVVGVIGRDKGGRGEEGGRFPRSEDRGGVLRIVPRGDVPLGDDAMRGGVRGGVLRNTSPRGASLRGTSLRGAGDRLMSKLSFGGEGEPLRELGVRTIFFGVFMILGPSRTVSVEGDINCGMMGGTLADDIRDGDLIDRGESDPPEGAFGDLLEGDLLEGDGGRT